MPTPTSRHSQEVLQRLGLATSTVRELGGRANRHWLIFDGDERLILRGYAAERSLASVAYEIEVQRRLGTQGWPVPEALNPPVEHANRVWCLFSYRDGRRPQPRTLEGQRRDQRKRGRVLAELHDALAELTDLGQRDDWVRQDEIFYATPSLEEVFGSWRDRIPEQVELLHDYAERTEQRLSDLEAQTQPAIVIHGDFTPWNIRFKHGELSAILDWEFTHLDHRVADFALSWRGIHDDVLRGYVEVSPLEPIEVELIVPIRWAWLLSGARQVLLRTRAGDTPELDWTLTQLTRPEHHVLP